MIDQNETTPPTGALLVQHDSILRLAEVRRRVSISTSTIYARMAAGDFPMVRRDGGIAYWLESEIDTYIAKVVARSLLGPAEVKRKAVRSAA